ncbi:MAG: YjgN family protein [Pseudomonadota bacterium]
MVDAKYDIVYKGKILDGYDFDLVRNGLVGLFNISPEKAEKILSARRVILKRGFNEQAARKFGLMLRKAGLHVVLIKSTVSETNGEPIVAAMSRDMAKSTAKERQNMRPEVSKPARPEDLPREPKISKIPFEFNGGGTEYFKIWLVNVLLSIVTLGIYSAWAKVRRKQYFYGSTRLHGSSFEYLADPMKILKGRLIVAGFFIVYSVLSELNVVAGVLMSLIFVVALPWLIVRSLSFNARNSAFRNIRFCFDGDIKEAAKVYVLWPIVGFFTLGILFPYVYFRQRKFIVENSSYGTTKFTFTAGRNDYYRIAFGALIPVGIGIVLVVGAGFLFIPIALLIGLVLYLYMFAYYSVKTTNLLYNSSQLSDHRFRANLDTFEYLLIVITNSLGTAVTLGLFHPWARVRALRYKLAHLSLVASGDISDFIAGAQEQVAALGEEVMDSLDFDFGL